MSHQLSPGHELQELLDLLKGLPLALAQAASYLRELRVTVAEYVDMYKQEWEDLMRHAESTTPLLDYPERSVATTWMISFKAIKRLNGAAAKLLQLWAFFDNKNMSYAIFQGTTDHIIARWFANCGEDQERPRWLQNIVDMTGGQGQVSERRQVLAGLFND